MTYRLADFPIIVFSNLFSNVWNLVHKNYTFEKKIIAMNAFTVFVIEDDPFYGEMLKYHISLNPDYVVEKFETGKACLSNLYKNPSVISLDYSFY